MKFNPITIIIPLIVISYTYTTDCVSKLEIFEDDDRKINSHINEKSIRGKLRAINI